MNRIFRALTVAALLPLLQGCVFAVIHGGKYAYREYNKQGQAVNTALTRIQTLILEGDRAGLAALFEAGAEWSEIGAASIVGRDAILSMLLPSGDARISELQFTVASTRLLSDGAVQNGAYRETVVRPDGTTLHQGMFNVRWSRQADGRWTVLRWRSAPNGEGDPFAEHVPDRDG